MASGKLSYPGTAFGPCLNGCSHRDCKDTRRMAKEICRICKKEIGYNKGFYSEGTSDNLVHAVCLEEEILEQSK